MEKKKIDKDSDGHPRNRDDQERFRQPEPSHDAHHSQEHGSYNYTHEGPGNSRRPDPSHDAQHSYEHGSYNYTHVGPGNSRRPDPSHDAHHSQEHGSYNYTHVGPGNSRRPDPSHDAHHSQEHGSYNYTHVGPGNSRHSEPYRPPNYTEHSRVPDFSSAHALDNLSENKDNVTSDQVHGRKKHHHQASKPKESSDASPVGYEEYPLSTEHKPDHKPDHSHRASSADSNKYKNKITNKTSSENEHITKGAHSYPISKRHGDDADLAMAIQQSLNDTRGDIAVSKTQPGSQDNVSHHRSEVSSIDKITADAVQAESNRRKALEKIRKKKTNDDNEYDDDEIKSKKGQWFYNYKNETNYKEARKKYVYFWKNEDIYSQWHKSKFRVNDKEFNCAEQFMMYKKAELFQDDRIAKEIIAQKNPRKIKALGREVRGFNEGLWAANCLYIVKQANVAKFSQSEKLKKEMFGTHPKLLVEASPYDKIWGIGLVESDCEAWDQAKWRGKNLLGYILTEVRDELMAEAGRIKQNEKQMYLEGLLAIQKVDAVRMIGSSVDPVPEHQRKGNTDNWEMVPKLPKGTHNSEYKDNSLREKEGETIPFSKKPENELQKQVVNDPGMIDTMSAITTNEWDSPRDFERSLSSTEDNDKVADTSSNFGRPLVNTKVDKQGNNELDKDKQVSDEEVKQPDGRDKHSIDDFSPEEPAQDVHNQGEENINLVKDDKEKETVCDNIDPNKVLTEIVPDQHSDTKVNEDKVQGQDSDDLSLIHLSFV